MSAVATPPAATTAAPPAPPGTPAPNPLGLPLQAFRAGIRRFSVDEYQALIRAGVIPERPGRAELVEGYLV